VELIHLVVRGGYPTLTCLDLITTAPPIYCFTPSMSDSMFNSSDESDDDEVPTVSFTLGQFVAHALSLSCNDNKYLPFVLTGRFLDDDGRPAQAFIDSIRDMVDDDHPLSIIRDYDSLLGLANDFLVDGTITMFTVPHPTLALTTSIHLKRDIRRGQVSPTPF